VYAAGWLAFVHLNVIVYEEPNLRRKFGGSYDRYTAPSDGGFPARLSEVPNSEMLNGLEADHLVPSCRRRARLLAFYMSRNVLSGKTSGRPV
jgi:hypothetical protein